MVVADVLPFICTYEHVCAWVRVCGACVVGDLKSQHSRNEWESLPDLLAASGPVARGRVQIGEVVISVVEQNCSECEPSVLTWLGRCLLKRM